MKRKLMLGLLSAVGGLTIIGSGFSAWYFEGSAEAKHSNIGVTVTDVVSEFGKIEATDSVGLILCLDQGGFKNKTNNEAGISFGKGENPNTLSGFDTYNEDFGATYSIEAGKSLHAKNAGLKATFKAVVTLKEAAAKYISFKETFTNAAGYTVPTYTAGSDVTFTLEQAFEFDGTAQTFAFNFNLKTDDTTLKNSAFKYTDGKKPQDVDALNDMRAELNVTDLKVLTFDYSLEVTAK